MDILQVRLEFLQPTDPMTGSEDEHISQVCSFVHMLSSLRIDNFSPLFWSLQVDQVGSYLENVQELQSIREELVCIRLEVYNKQKDSGLSSADEDISPLKRWVDSLYEQAEDYNHSLCAHHPLF